MIEIDSARFHAGFEVAFGKPGPQAYAGIEFLVKKISADPRWNRVTEVSYGMATFAWETGRTFQPIEERGPDSYFSRYDPPNHVALLLGNVRVGDGLRYKGRGYAQITGFSNYRKFGLLLKLDLVNTPGRVCEPEIAYEIATRGMIYGLFTGRKLADYIDDHHADYLNTRRVINGVPQGQVMPDHAQDIARIAAKFESVLLHSVNAAL